MFKTNRSYSSGGVVGSAVGAYAGKIFIFSLIIQKKTKLSAINAWKCPKNAKIFHNKPQKKVSKNVRATLSD